MQEQSPKIDLPVFAIAAGISVAFVLVGALFQVELASVVGDVLDCVLTNLGWMFVLSTAAFLILVPRAGRLARRASLKSQTGAQGGRNHQDRDATSRLRSA
jgi:hypothetical protein